MGFFCAFRGGGHTLRRHQGQAPSHGRGRGPSDGGEMGSLFPGALRQIRVRAGADPYWRSGLHRIRPALISSTALGRQVRTGAHGALSPARGSVPSPPGNFFPAGGQKAAAKRWRLARRFLPSSPAFRNGNRNGTGQGRGAKNRPFPKGNGRKGMRRFVLISQCSLRSGHRKDLLRIFRSICSRHHHHQNESGHIR